MRLASKLSLTVTFLVASLFCLQASSPAFWPFTQGKSVITEADPTPPTVDVESQCSPYKAKLQALYAKPDVRFPIDGPKIRVAKNKYYGCLHKYSSQETAYLKSINLPTQNSNVPIKDQGTHDITKKERKELYKKQMVEYKARKREWKAQLKDGTLPKGTTLAQFYQKETGKNMPVNMMAIETKSQEPVEPVSKLPVDPNCAKGNCVHPSFKPTTPEKD